MFGHRSFSRGDAPTVCTVCVASHHWRPRYLFSLPCYFSLSRSVWCFGVVLAASVLRDSRWCMAAFCEAETSLFCSFLSFQPCRCCWSSPPFLLLLFLVFGARSLLNVQAEVPENAHHRLGRPGGNRHIMPDGDNHTVLDAGVNLEFRFPCPFFSGRDANKLPP